MKPCKFADANAVLAGDGMDDLPIYRDPGIPVILSRWRASLRERLSILFFGNVWLAALSANCPPVAIAGGRGAAFDLPGLPPAEFTETGVVLHWPDLPESEKETG